MIDAPDPGARPDLETGREARPLVLNAANARRMDEALEICRGDPAWRARKRIEIHDLLLLSQQAPPGRLAIGPIDLRNSLRVVMLLEAPVPCRPAVDGPVVVATGAVIRLVYPEEATRAALPGWAFVEVLDPARVWLACVGGPNPSGEPGQAVHLGPRLPAEIGTRQLVLMTYEALTMQFPAAERDGTAAVLNAEAARFWEQKRRLVPLTANSFFAPAVARPPGIDPAT